MKLITFLLPQYLVLLLTGIKKTLDYKMGLMIVSGGVVGTIIGIMTFTFFSEIGKISLIISLLYMYLLAIVGTLMLIEGIRERNRLKSKINYTIIIGYKVFLLE